MLSPTSMTNLDQPIASRGFVTPGKTYAQAASSSIFKSNLLRARPYYEGHIKVQKDPQQSCCAGDKPGLPDAGPQRLDVVEGPRPSRDPPNNGALPSSPPAQVTLEQASKRRSESGVYAACDDLDCSSTRPDPSPPSPTPNSRTPAALLPALAARPHPFPVWASWDGASRTRSHARAPRVSRGRVGPLLPSPPACRPARSPACRPVRRPAARRPARRPSQKVT